MRLISIVTACLLGLLQVANALNSNELRGFKGSNNNNVIKLTSKNMDALLSGPSDSHILLLLTATQPEVGCLICQTIAPEFQKVAASWAAEHPQGDQLFFVQADFADGDKAVFQKFQLNNVPKLYLYPPTTEDRKFNEGFENVNVPQDPTLFASFVSGTLASKTGVAFEIIEPLNYGSIIITAVGTFVIVFLAKRNIKSLSTLAVRKELWGAVTVMSILFFVTGYMFNTIRGTPYIRAGPAGDIQYFAPGQQSQVGAETQAMTFIYLVLAFGLVSLVTKAKKVTNERVHLVVVVGLLSVILVMYSVLISIFQFKSQGYPFHLLNIWSP